MQIYKEKVNRYTKKKECEVCYKAIEKGKNRLVMEETIRNGWTVKYVFCSKKCFRKMISRCLRLV